MTVLIGDIVNIPRIYKCRKEPEKFLANSRSFFYKNRFRVNAVCDMLADDESRKQYIAAIKYRTECRRIKRSEWSLTDQYFPKDIIKIHDEEVFIDGGAYNGDTIQKLFNMTNFRQSGRIRIIAFEPGELNMRHLKKRYEKDNRIVFKQSGLSDKSGELFFLERGSSSYITDKDHANRVVNVSAIDDIDECQNATWIKMDIEGAEWDALHGAEKTIRRNMPTLTICIYHSDEDMIRIAEWIHVEFPDYKLYIRHHTRRDHETVLYAVKDNE